MGPSRSCWNGTSALQPEEITSKGTTVSCVYYQWEYPYEKKSGNLFNDPRTYSSSVRIRDVALGICQKRWTIGRSGEKGSGISVLAARHDDCFYEIYLLIRFLFVFISFLFISYTFIHNLLVISLSINLIIVCLSLLKSNNYIIITIF